MLKRYLRNTASTMFFYEEIFKRLVKDYPRKELQLIDLTLKMFTNPVLELDSNMLVDAILEEKRSVKNFFRASVWTMLRWRVTLNSLVLVSLGCDAPYKKSKTTGQQTFALAKNDALFQALLNHEREDVALL